MISRMSISNANESRWIAVLLVLILMVVGGIAWHAQRTFTTHGEVAVAVLTDYAELAADQFARQAMAAAGYNGYYLSMNALRTGDFPETGSGLSPVSQAFDFESLADAAAMGPVVAREIAETVTDAPPEAGFAVLHANDDGLQRTLVISWTTGSERIIGFEVDRDWLSQTLATVLNESTLLPESLADGQVANADLYIRLDDINGVALFESGRRYDGTPSASHKMTDDYNGVFAGHTVQAAIDPLQAEKLLIGGLPESRLPLLIGVFLIVAILLIAAIRQLQRESALVRMRSDFVSEVSHELRTPLTQIRMFTESLIHGRLTSSDDRRRALSIINRETQRLIQMVENILRFSRAHRNGDEIQREAVDLVPLVASVVDDLQYIAAANQSDIHLDAVGSLIAKVDRDALRQILINLVDNAAKYGPSEQTIRVRLSERNGFAVIKVSDSGPGIPVADRSRIWGDYIRLDRERTSAIAGTGIGLAVVQDLVLRHDGSVRVEESDDGGACFVVELPL